MPSPQVQVKFPIRRKTNFVKEQARTRISKTATKKDYIPGVYAQHQ